MSRRAVTAEDRRRAELLAEVLRVEKDERRLSVQAIADESQVGYETVRAVLSARSSGPSFFLVADIARALHVRLDVLDRRAR
jgi:DNA-binding phage protein